MEDASDSSNGGAHPLENHVILNRIFDLLTVQDLKVCRQVCKLWLDSSKISWQSSTVVSLHSPPGARNPKIIRFLDFLEDPLNNCSPSSFRRFSISCDNQRFWTLCGPTVKSLELCWTDFESVDDFRKVVYQSCPQMEELILRRVETKGAPTFGMEEPTQWEEPRFGVNKTLKSLTVILHKESFGVTWMEFFNHFPYLESLNLRGDFGPYDNLFRSLSLIHEKDPTLLNLKHIDTQGLQYADCPDLKNLLRNKNFRFQSLTIRLYDSDSEENFKSILTTHKSSLNKLDLYRDVFSQMDPVNVFPESLENLQELVLHSKIFSSYRFLKCMPNLRKLVIPFLSGALLRRTDGEDMVGFRLEKCKELKIKGVDWNSSGEDSHDEIDLLFDWIPNVERLYMPLNNYSIQLAAKHWSNLISLEIVRTIGAEINDCGITGMDGGDVRRINADGEDKDWRPITAPRANITAFKNLKTLIIDLHPGLGYCSIIYGIRELANLQHLLVRNYMNPQREIWTRLQAEYQVAKGANSWC